MSRPTTTVYCDEDYQLVWFKSALTYNPCDPSSITGYWHVYDTDYRHYKFLAFHFKMSDV